MSGRGIALGVLCLPLTALAAGPVDSVTIEAVKRVLQDYAAQSQLQRPQFVELYSDRARVRAQVAGTAAPQVWPGRAYKHWLRGALVARQVALDASQFRQVQLERRGRRLVVRAQRYAANRCYWDTEYWLALEREGARWLIVEEVITTQPHAQCAPVAAAPPGAGRAAVTGAQGAGVTPIARRPTERPPPGAPTLTPPQQAALAWQLAHQIAAARVAQSGQNGQASQGGAPPAPGGAGRGTAAASLWVTPQ